VGLSVSVATSSGGVWLGDKGVVVGVAKNPHAVARNNPTIKTHLFVIARL